MTLEELAEDVETTYNGLGEEFALSLDRQTRTELAVLQAALGSDDLEDVVHRAVHLLFQSTVDTGRLDLHLRQHYGVTYDEYLSGMTYDEMRGASEYEARTEDDRRYQF